MCIYLGTSTHYEVDGLTDYRRFLRGVPTLVQPDDLLAFSSYGVRCFDIDGVRNDRPGRPRPEIRRFLELHQLPPDVRILEERKTLGLYRDEHPDAFAVLWPADRDLLRQLEEMLADSIDHSEFCDHVMGYGPRGELFCFHDAFEGQLLISTRVPRSQVEQFCQLLDLTYEISDREV